MPTNQHLIHRASTPADSLIESAVITKDFNPSCPICHTNLTACFSEYEGEDVFGEDLEDEASAESLQEFLDTQCFADDESYDFLDEFDSGEDQAISRFESELAARRAVDHMEPGSIAFPQEFLQLTTLYVEQLEQAQWERSEEFWQARENAYHILTDLLIEIYRVPRTG